MPCGCGARHCRPTDAHCVSVAWTGSASAPRMTREPRQRAGRRVRDRDRRGANSDQRRRALVLARPYRSPSSTRRNSRNFRMPPCPTVSSPPAKARSPAPGSPSRPTVTTTASSATRSRVGIADGSLVVIRRQQVAVSLHPQWAGGLPAGAAGLSTPGTPSQFFSAAVARKLFS